MPEEKKILDKILPKDYVDLDNVGLWIDCKTNEIVASDGLVILTLTIPPIEEYPTVSQFIQMNGKEVDHEFSNIRIWSMRARMMNIDAVNIIWDGKKKWSSENDAPTGLDIISKEWKITVYDFQLWGGSPFLKEHEKNVNLFWQDMSNVMVATKAKILFDQIIIGLWSDYYQISHDITSATWTTKNGYQFHLMMRTPLTTE